MIQSLSSMVAAPGNSTSMPDGRWARAVPEPFHGGIFDRARDAWAVLRGRVYAVRWPEAGELEIALSPRERPAALTQEPRP